MKEIWKDIKGYEGYYKISNLGRVKSLRRKKDNGIMKKYLDTQGYPKVSLTINYKLKSYLIHRIVAFAFVLKHKNDTEVNHINGIKHDNMASNLEWCTAKENSIHAVNTGLRISLKGESHSKSKLDNQKVLEIRALSKSDFSITKLAKIYKVNSGTIHDVINYRTWKHI